MLLAQAIHHHQTFEWSNPHWGWFFAGMIAGAIVISLIHRIPGR